MQQPSSEGKSNMLAFLKAFWNGVPKEAAVELRQAHGNKNGSYTKKGPGRYHLQGGSK